jgi:hypothetical protein
LLKLTDAQVRVLRKSVHASQTHPPATQAPATAVSPADSQCESPTKQEQMMPRFHGDEMVGWGMGVSVCGLFFLLLTKGLVFRPKS